MRKALVLMMAAGAIGILCVAWLGAEDKPAAGLPIWEPVQIPPEVTQPRWVDADKDGALYLADIKTGIWKLSGGAWKNINGDLPYDTEYKKYHAFTISVDPNMGNLFAGMPGMPKKGYPTCYYRSTDQGSHWTSVEGNTQTNNPAFDGVCFLPNGDILFAGAYQPGNCVGVFFSTDHGKTCKRAEGTGSGGAAFSVGYNPVTKECWMGAEVQGKSVFRSTDMGRSWALVPIPAVPKDKDHQMADMMHVAFNDAGDVFFQSFTSVYRSKDKGATWEEVYDSGSTTHHYGGFLRKDPNGYLYAGHAIAWRKNPVVARSMAGGDKGSWKDFSSGIPGEYRAACIVYNPGDGRMYCDCLDDRVEPKKGFIYRTIEPVAKPAPAKPAAPPADAPAKKEKP